MTRSTRSSARISAAAASSSDNSPTPSSSSTLSTPTTTTPSTVATDITFADDNPSNRGSKRGVKRQASPESPVSVIPRMRLVFDSVSLPIKRSKLATEKTASADNLTLDQSSRSFQSSSSNPLHPSTSVTLNSDLDSETAGDTEVDSVSISQHDPDANIPVRQSRAVARQELRSAQPFNVGTNSSVVKRSAADLNIDSSEDDTDSTRDRNPATATRSRGKGKGKSKAQSKKPVHVSSDEIDEFEPSGINHYAMDSDDEMQQLEQAIEESKKDKKMTTPRKASAAKSRPRGRKSQSSGGKESKSGTPLRVVVARAAEKRLRAVKKEPGDITEDTIEASSTPTSLDTSPVSSGSNTPFSDSDLSSLESSNEESEIDDEEFYDDDDDDVPLKSKRGKRLDGKKGDRLPKEWRKLVAQDPRLLDDKDFWVEMRRRVEEQKVIKIKEAQLKGKMKRKLTQGEKNHIRLCLHHPELENVWGDLAANIEPVKPVPMEAHPSLKLTLLPFQKESLYWMKKQEEGPWAGGMLADEMGMGKTIQTIALLLSEPRHKPSLVVAPVVALMQWKHEIETHAEGFTVCLWHGAGRMKVSDLKKFDVVLVSYGTLEASFRRQHRGFRRGDLMITEQSPMHAFQWHRVVLDEAHNIKERSTNAAKAAFALKAKYRWCLSGTPLQNRVGELYSLVRFLGADPFSYYFCKRCDCKSLHWQFTDRRHCDKCKHTPMDHVSLWNSEILTPIARYGIEEGGPGKTAFKKLKILLDRMMLRRTKLERADDLGLPPRTIVVRRDFFSPAEKELYMSLFTNAKRQFNTYLDSGTVLNNYSNIFSLITRMRQMACHPDLVLKSKTSTLAQAVTEGTVCRICNDTAEDAIVSACKHVFDRECIKQYLEVQQMRGHKPECPVCHIEISIDLEQESIDDDENTKKARQGILSRLNLENWRSSSKLEALVEELEKLRGKDCTIKSLVFSQFVSFLDLIAFRLQRAGFNICRLEGGMTPQQRDATIQHFMKNTQVTVFLISLKAGGVALNLTEASMVFMMDSWWNPSVEYQAMDRIHRLGQKRPVKVVKLVVEDSIEDQIVQLQHKKLAMTEAALSTDPDAALGKLTVEDLGFLFKL